MEFFGIGPGELLLILVVALIVFGPQKLPEIGQTLGRTIREFKRASSEFTAELNRELRVEESQRAAQQVTRAAATEPRSPELPVVAPPAQPPAPAVAAPSVRTESAVDVVVPEAGANGTGGEVGGPSSSGSTHTTPS